MDQTENWASLSMPMSSWQQSGNAVAEGSLPRSRVVDPVLIPRACCSLFTSNCHSEWEIYIRACLSPHSQSLSTQLPGESSALGRILIDTSRFLLTPSKNRSNLSENGDILEARKACVRALPPLVWKINTDSETLTYPVYKSVLEPVLSRNTQTHPLITFNKIILIQRMGQWATPNPRAVNYTCNSAGRCSAMEPIVP